jgi:hypothetical protein
MKYDKKLYEERITSSQLFSLDRETEFTAYKRESLKMVENLYCYLMAVNEHDYEPYGCEIMEVATRCINNYDVSKGVFLHYFNSAWRQEYSHIIGKAVIEERFRGIKITDEERRGIQKYLKLAERLSSSCTRSELYEKIASAMGIPAKKVQLLAELSGLRVVAPTTCTEDGEEIDVWSQISDGTSIEEEMEMADSVSDLLDLIEQAFCGLQTRQKPIVSDMITAKILPVLANKSGIYRYTFISNDVLNVLDTGGSCPTQREIAEKYGRNEASLSRTLKEFTTKLQILLREV